MTSTTIQHATGTRLTLGSFNQHANGSFTTWVRPNTPHCGPRSSDMPIRMEFKYRVELTYHAKALDPQGFLLDNTHFRAYFEGYRDSQIGASCEQLACIIAQDFCRELGDRLCACMAVMVAISAVQDVWVSCSYMPTPAYGRPVDAETAAIGNMRQDIYAGA